MFVTLHELEELHVLGPDLVLDGDTVQRYGPTAECVHEDPELDGLDRILGARWHSAK
jgi:hypothetical protein